MALAPPEWPDFLRIANSALRFFTFPWRFLIAVYRAMLSASLVERWLLYRVTCTTRVMFDVVRLVTAAQSYAMTCAKLEKSMDISMVLCAVPVL